MYIYCMYVCILIILNNPAILMPVCWFLEVLLRPSTRGLVKRQSSSNNRGNFHQVTNLPLASGNCRNVTSFMAQ